MIKDRMVLGLIAGIAGNAVKTVIDEVSIKKKISQRSFRETAAGIWVSQKSEATNLKGQILGGLLDFGMASMGGIGIVHLLSKTGRDHVITKGVLSGIAIGSFITALVSAFPQNRIRPKDAASNLSYMASNAIYGVVAAAVAGKLGHASLFDAAPQNDYLAPTELTTEQKKQKKQDKASNNEPDGS